MRRRVKKFKEDHTVWFIAIVAVLVLLAIIFWVKIGLYVNFIIGNDILIKIDADKDTFLLKNSEQENIKVEASIKTNPFCKAECTMNFVDMSDNTTLDSQKFTLTTGTPFSHTYSVTNSNDMQGQDVYSFKMECSGKATFFCHTNEAATRRDMIITVDHVLNEQQQEKKDSMKSTLLLLTKDLQTQYLLFNSLNNQDINQLDDLNEKLILEKNALDFAYKSMMQIDDLWKDQKFNEIASIIENSQDMILGKIKEADSYNSEIMIAVGDYNILAGNMTTSRQKVILLGNNEFTNYEMFTDVSRLVIHFNNAIETFVNAKDMESRKSAADWITAETESVYNNITYDIMYEVLEREISGDSDYDTLCRIDSNYCFTHPYISERAVQSSFDVGDSCTYINYLASDLYVINMSLENYVNSTYPDEEEFWNNVSDILSNRKREIMIGYVNGINENHTNYEMINQIIEIPGLKAEAGYSQPYIKNAIVWQLIKESEKVCSMIPSNVPDVINISINPLIISETEETSADLGIYFEEPMEQCCLFGECYDCCMTEECRNGNESYPVIFVHGHAVNKEVNAEYSLDIFNDLQDKLEGNGYLNAGAINLYAKKGSYEGKWAKIPVPVTIKVSYYFDVLQEDGNYQIIQTKSENIETYSIRLKEIIDIIKEKTGRQKVRIVAHSMGGLVVRRYLQLFGEENVDSVVFVGTPHKGVSGNVADLCPLLGEKLECRDLSEDSTFIKKLESGGLPKIPVVNIVGVGCEMDNEDGDGIVLKRESFVEEFDNYIVNGTCSGTQFLHSGMLELDKYPQVYKVIKSGLD